MRSGKPGPVLVEVPNPVFEATHEGKLDYVPVPMARTAPDPDAVKAAAKMLLAAKKPVLWAGQGVHYADASERLAALAELIPAPVVATNPGKSAIPENHPLALGAATRSSPKMFATFLKDADLVLAVGSSLTKTNFGPGVPSGKTLIHSTNDAGDVNKDYRADLALVGDAALVLDALIAEVGKTRAPDARALGALKQRIAAAKDEWLAEWAKHLDSDEVPINQYRVIRDLMRTVDRADTIVTHDSGSPREQLLPFWETTAAHLLHGLGQVDPARLRARHHHGRQAGGARQAVHQRDGQLVVRHDRARHRDRGAQPHPHPHHRVQQRHHGGRAQRAAGLDQEVRRARRRRQLRQGGGRASASRRAASTSRPTSSPAIKGAVDVVDGGAPYLLEFVVKEGQEFSRY